jgi:hypothetical protein
MKKARSKKSRDTVPLMGLTTIASFLKPTKHKIVVKKIKKIMCDASRILCLFLCFLLAGEVGKIHLGKSIPAYGF